MRNVFYAPTKVTAYFPSATGIYAGDEVRVSGVKVGKINSIEPDGTQARITMSIDRGVPIPRRRQGGHRGPEPGRGPLCPADPGLPAGQRPEMASGAVIPIDRTAVPVEWDEVKNQVMRLATDLGRRAASATSVSRFIDSAANALDGNGEKLRQTIAQLSGVSRVLAEGSGNIVDVIKNLQTVVSTCGTATFRSSRSRTGWRR